MTQGNSSSQHDAANTSAALPTLRPSGNTILITGGGSGIGRELALRLNALGNTVIVAGRRLQALQQTIDGRQQMFAMELDINDPVSIHAFAERVWLSTPR